MSANRLGQSASAYLQSAAHQPVNWFPWGDEAFAAAREHDRPVLLDIGAVWCHWCHVMDGESYEDPELARLLNEEFVCVKVDRDERPDVDARYQRAVQSLTRQGGWPLTVFLTPSGEVFYGGTYFPPDGKYGRPGFRSVLAAVLDAWRSRREQVQSQADAIRRVVTADLDEAVAGDLSPSALQDATSAILRVFDPVHGGFGGQPKFPHPGALTFLLNQWHDSGDAAVRRVVDRTLEGMGRGGVYDQLGGGFHRYSVDAQWIVPHFEKMSYDNSELLKIYLDAYARFGTEEYAEVARGIVRWVREVLAESGGGYGASQDADVGLDDDGNYFTWTREEAAAALTDDQMEIAAACYDIGTAGEMHHDPGRNVLFVAEPLAAVAARSGRTIEESRQLLDSARYALLEVRALRPAPFVDRSRYTSWNTMMASALLRAGHVLGDVWSLTHALETMSRIRRESAEPDAVAHTEGGRGGLLDDQVQVAAAALDAAEATGDRAWLDWAERIMDRVWTDYWDDEHGGLFDTPRGRESEPGLLPARAKPVQDTPTPSPNGVAGIVFARLHELTRAPRWRERSAALIRAFAGRPAELGVHTAAYLLAADWHLNPATHLVIVGEPGDESATAMHAAALATFFPRRVVWRLSLADAGHSALPPVLQAMIDTARGTRGYACTGTSCSAPAEDPESWRATLAALHAAVPM
ncbi:MAG: thioredoxin domain-containing protein [Gemmatimonadales bacterium]